MKSILCMALEGILVLTLFGVLGMHSAFASDFFHSHSEPHGYRKGWFWYHDRDVAKVEKEKKAKKKQAQLNQKQLFDPNHLEDPNKQMEEIRKAVKTARNRAVIAPTDENVHQYIQMQNQVAQQAQTFQKVWGEVLLNHPEDNYSIKHPTNAVGVSVSQDIQYAHDDRVIQHFAQTTGLFFFYRSTCPYCQRFAPILRRFVDEYHIPVVAITTDGISLPEFPNSVADQGQSRKFNVTVEPAVFAVNPKTHKAYPVAWGLVSEETLKSNIVNVAKAEGALWKN